MLVGDDTSAVIELRTGFAGEGRSAHRSREQNRGYRMTRAAPQHEGADVAVFDDNGADRLFHDLDSGGCGLSNLLLRKTEGAHPETGA